MHEFSSTPAHVHLEENYGGVFKAFADLGGETADLVVAGGMTVDFHTDGRTCRRSGPRPTALLLPSRLSEARQNVIDDVRAVIPGERVRTGTTVAGGTRSDEIVSDHSRTHVLSGVDHKFLDVYALPGWSAPTALNGPYSAHVNMVTRSALVVWLLDQPDVQEYLEGPDFHTQAGPFVAADVVALLATTPEIEIRSFAHNALPEVGRWAQANGISMENFNPMANFVVGMRNPDVLADMRSWVGNFYPEMAELIDGQHVQLAMRNAMTLNSAFEVNFSQEAVLEVG